jgi:hypothetical protein
MMDGYQLGNPGVAPADGASGRAAQVAHASSESRKTQAPGRQENGAAGRPRRRTAGSAQAAEVADTDGEWQEF